MGLFNSAAMYCIGVLEILRLKQFIGTESSLFWLLPYYLTYSGDIDLDNYNLGKQVLEYNLHFLFGWNLGMNPLMEP